MRIPSDERRAPAWLATFAPLAGAALALAAAGYFTFAGIDYARHGCGCHEPLFPDWIWGVMLAISVPFYAVAALLVLRVVRRILTP